MSIAFTKGALLIGISLLLTVGIVPAVLAYLHLDAWTELLVAVARWPLLDIVHLRFGPSREKAK